MTTTQHTTGPWIFTGNAGQVFAFNSRKIADCGNAGMSKENASNARLISAAPELLLIAKDYVLFCERHDLEGATLDAARAAIAKAEGVA